MEMRNVTIIGVGAVGCLYGSKLREHLGREALQVLASGERLERYRRDGIFFNGRKVDFSYVNPKEAKKSDVVIIATKNLQMESVLDEMSATVGDGTVIMSLLNGIESERLIAERYGEEKVLYSFAAGLSSMREGNRIDATAEGRIVFGEKDNRETERVKAIERLFGESGIAFRVPEDITLEMWKKFMLNTAFNTLSAITWSGYGDFVNPALQALVRAVSRETIAVAKAEGIGLTEEMVEENIRMITSLPKNGMTSMFQDMVAGRGTENDYFCATVVRLGRKHGIDTPVAKTLYLLARAEEESRRRAMAEHVSYGGENQERTSSSEKS